MKTIIALLAAVLGVSVSAQVSRPNVLFLFSDQHHAAAMGCAGHTVVKTPNLDALAKRGLRFTRAYCQDAICTPSRISLMTGLYPRTTGILTNGDEDHISDARNYYPLQQAFQAAGYFTAVSGKLHLGKKQIVQGWDRGATALPLKMDPVQESYFDWIKEKGHEKAFTRDWNGSMNADLGTHLSELPPEYRDAPYTADRATAYIREAIKAGKPFFCWASFHGPHQPYTPPKKWADLYPTLCEITGLGLKRPQGTWPLAGQSLVALLKTGHSNNRTVAFSENWSQSTIIGPRYKLGVWTNPLPAYQKWNWLAKGAKDQLYDLKNDPLEVHNLIGTPEVAAIEKELRDALTVWKARNGEGEMQRVSDAIVARPPKPKKKQ